MSLLELSPKEIFDRLDKEPNRTRKIQDAKQYSKWTIPSVFPELDINEGTLDELRVNSQSIGAQLVSSLSNKLSLTLLTPQRPFFKLEVDEKEKAEVINSGISESELEVELSKIERLANKELDVMSIRPNLTSALELAIVTGEALLKIPKKGSNGKVQTFELRSYVVERSLDGNIVQIITKEKIRFSELSESNQELALFGGIAIENETQELDIYTRLLRAGKRWNISQSIDTVMLNSSGSFGGDDFPYLVLPWNLRRGENHGRGLVEVYAADFSELERLSDSLSKLAAITSRIIILTDPNSMSDPQQLNAASDGSFVAGREEDYHILNVAEKLGDANFIIQIRDQVERRLGQVFQILTPRDKERVTAEEIRQMANQLETSLGGVFSRFAEEFQKPLAKLLLNRIDFELSKGIEPIIVTGLDSLSRNAELEAMGVFLQSFAQLQALPPEVLKWLKTGNIANKTAAGLGLDPKELVHSEQEVAQMDQQEQQRQQQIIQQQEAAKAASGIAQQAVKA